MCDASGSNQTGRKVNKAKQQVPIVFVPFPVQSDKSTRRATFAGQKENNRGLEEGEWIHVTRRTQNQKAKSVVGCLGY